MSGVGQAQPAAWCNRVFLAIWGKWILWEGLGADSAPQEMGWFRSGQWGHTAGEPRAGKTLVSRTAADPSTRPVRAVTALSCGSAAAEAGSFAPNLPLPQHDIALLWSLGCTKALSGCSVLAVPAHSLAWWLGYNSLSLSASSKCYLFIWSTRQFCVWQVVIWDLWPFLPPYS